jgi:hypothetical protein
MLGQSEHVAFGLRHEIKPAFAGMNDNNDLALPAPVFDGAPCAFFAVDLSSVSFENCAAGHLVAKVFEIFPFYVSLLANPQSGVRIPDRVGFLLPAVPGIPLPRKRRPKGARARIGVRNLG